MNTDAPPDDFKVVCIYNTFNEEDVVESALLDALQQGAHVHVIDHHSTDTTWSILQKMKQADGTHVQIQKSRVPKGFNLSALAREKEDVALARYKNCWVLHIDIDELRRSPWPTLNLRESLYRVEIEGYNAVNHLILEFKPRDGLQQASPLLDHFSDCYFRKLYCKQIKTWKQGSVRANLAGMGEQCVNFPGMRVYPRFFLLVHFPFRSWSQAVKKVFRERKPLYNRRERRAGMHTHYNKYTSLASMKTQIAAVPSNSYHSNYSRYLTLSLPKPASQPKRPQLPKHRMKPKPAPKRMMNPKPALKPSLITATRAGDNEVRPAPLSGRLRALSMRPTTKRRLARNKPKKIVHLARGPTGFVVVKPRTGPSVPPLTRYRSRVK